MKKKEIDKTKLSNIKRVMDSVLRNNPLQTDPDITFEFLMQSCYPNIFNNVQQRLSQEHMDGYLEGLAAGKDLTLDEVYDIIKEKGEK